MKTSKYLFIFLVVTGILAFGGGHVSAAPWSGGNVLGAVFDTTQDNASLSRTFLFDPAGAQCPTRASDENPILVGYSSFRLVSASVEGASFRYGVASWDDPNLSLDPKLTFSGTLGESTQNGTYTISAQGVLEGRCNDYADYDVTWNVDGDGKFVVDRQTQSQEVGTILFSAETSDGKTSSQSVSATIYKSDLSFSTVGNDTVGGGASIASTDAPSGYYFIEGGDVSPTSFDISGLTYTYNGSQSVLNGQLEVGDSLELSTVYTPPKLNLDAVYTTSKCFEKSAWQPMGADAAGVTFKIRNPNSFLLNLNPGEYDVSVAGTYSVEDVSSSNTQYTLCDYSPSSASFGGSNTITAYFSTNGVIIEDVELFVTANAFCQDQNTTAVMLNWDDVKASRYDIYEGDTKIGSVTGTSFLVTGVEKGSDVQYKVDPIDAPGYKVGYVEITTPSDCSVPPSGVCTSASSLVLNPSSRSTTIGGTASFVALFDPDGPGGNTYGDFDVTSAATWTSDDASIASVQSKGTYRGENIGTTYVHASYCKIADGTVVVTGGELSPDFTIGITPDRQRVQRGETARYTVDVSAINGFSGTVSLALSNVASNISGSISPVSVIVGGKTEIASAEVSLTPNQFAAIGTSRFRVTGTSGSIIHFDEADIEVYDATFPTASLQADPTIIASGGSSDLIWDSTNADSCSIDQGVGSVCASSGACDAGGAEGVSPLQSTTYTLTCLNENGSATDTATVTVDAGSGGFACSLSSSPDAGAFVILTTSIQNGSGEYTCLVDYGDGDEDPSYGDCSPRRHLYPQGTYTATTDVRDVSSGDQTSCSTQIGGTGDVGGGAWANIEFLFYEKNSQTQQWNRIYNWNQLNVPEGAPIYHCVDSTASGFEDRCFSAWGGRSTPINEKILDAQAGNYWFEWMTPDWFSVDIVYNGDPSANVLRVEPNQERVITYYVSVYLDDALPDSCAIQASPTSILWGQSSELSWSCANPEGKTCTIDQGVGAADPNEGVATVKPKTNTTYTLQCSGVPDSTATVRVGFLPLLREIIPR